jgi:O-antigen ligase
MGYSASKFIPSLQESSSLKPLSVYLIYALCLLLVLFPWANPAVSHGGSTVYNVLLVGGLVFGWTQYSKFGSEERIVLFAYVGLLGVVALSLVNAENWFHSMRFVDRYLRVAGIFPVCLLLCRGGQLASKAFLVGCVIAGPLLAARAWYQTEILELELARGAYHHIMFSYLSALAVTIVLAGLITLARQWWHYAFGLLSVATGLVATLFSGGRNAWFFLVLLMLLLPWLYRRALGRRHLRWMVGVVVLSVLTVALWRPSFVFDRLADGLDDLKMFSQDPSVDTSLGTRLNLWRNSLLIFSQSPLLGTGIGDFQRDNSELVALGMAYLSTEPFSHAHSIYFHALAEMGIIGFAAIILSLLILPLRYFCMAWRTAVTPEGRFCALAGFLSIFAFAVFGIGEAWLTRNPTVNAYAVSVAIFLAGVVTSKTDSPPPLLFLRRGGKSKGEPLDRS